MISQTVVEIFYVIYVFYFSLHFCILFLFYFIHFSRAMKAALKKADKIRDLLILVNLFSSWDLLNDEKNAGKGSLYQQQSYAEAEGFRVKSIQRPSSNIYNDSIAVILEFKAHQVFIVSVFYCRIC
jgi:hypothetical protein